MFENHIVQFTMQHSALGALEDLIQARAKETLGISLAYPSSWTRKSDDLIVRFSHSTPRRYPGEPNGLSPYDMEKLCENALQKLKTLFPSPTETPIPCSISMSPDDEWYNIFCAFHFESSLAPS